MTNCPVCQRDTSPVKIGGQIYCSVCGTAAGSESKNLIAIAPARRLSLDLSPRNRATAAPAQPSAPKPASPPHPHAADAQALHGRAKPSRILDLRHAAPHTPEPHPAPQPLHDTPAAAPHATTHARHEARFNDRFEKARQVARSQSINKFAGGMVAPPAPEASTPHAPTVVNRASAMLPELPKLAATHHEAMTRLEPNLPAPTPAHANAQTSWRPHLDLSPANNRTMATVAAVALMSGYVWLQNYPKLALQNANSKAGLSASLPAFLPSSYTLKTTDTSPGLITLNFTSPSASEALKIAQARTTWDSSSLLDNFVAKNTDDYATVQGQGLTIYLFNNNQATWVNHGIWYSIEGASRLSREQILKIAYSL